MRASLQSTSHETAQSFSFLLRKVAETVSLAVSLGGTKYKDFNQEAAREILGGSMYIGKN